MSGEKIKKIDCRPPAIQCIWFAKGFYFERDVPPSIENRYSWSIFKRAGHSKVFVIINQNEQPDKYNSLCDDNYWLFCARAENKKLAKQFYENFNSLSHINNYVYYSNISYKHISTIVPHLDRVFPKDYRLVKFYCNTDKCSADGAAQQFLREQNFMNDIIKDNNIGTKDKSIIFDWLKTGKRIFRKRNNETAWREFDIECSSLNTKDYIYELAQNLWPRRFHINFDCEFNSEDEFLEKVNNIKQFALFSTLRYTSMPFYENNSNEDEDN